MPYQIPKSNHPWRRYQNKTDTETKPQKKIKALKVLICEIAENWDNVKIVTTSYGRYGEFTLGELTQDKQAQWLVGIIKRNYVQY